MRRTLTPQLPISLLCTGALLVGAAACSDGDDTSTSDDPTSTSTSSASTTTSTTEPSGPQDILTYDFDDHVPPGEYFADPDNDPSTPLRVVFEVAEEGWSGGIAGPARFTSAGHTGIAFLIVDNLAADGCGGPALADPPVGPSVDDLATALSELNPFELTEPPTDVTLLGHEGKHLKITVPDLTLTDTADDPGFADCVDGSLYSWHQSGEDVPFYGYNGEPGRYDEYWILDVDGTRLLISINSSPAMPPEYAEQAHAILDSAHFETG